VKSQNKNVKVAALIIAAGESNRLGIPKQLIKWKDKTLIEHIINLIKDTNLSPVIVVLGAYRNEISNVLRNTGISILINNHWQEGKASSIRIGINNLTKDIDAVIIFVVDQPYLNKDVIDSIIDTYTRKKSLIIAPQINGIFINPVLFDHAMFKELKMLNNNEGGLVLFNKYPVEVLPWSDERLLIDIDRLEDLTKLMEQGDI
jgi:molybdenum cofactor cytidylyltransferase